MVQGERMLTNVDIQGGDSLTKPHIVGANYFIKLQFQGGQNLIKPNIQGDVLGNAG
jgi:hypothetical protein